MLNKVRFLSLLISLELMMMSVIFLSLFKLFSSIWLVFLIVCFAVCEASVGLALLVMMIRLNGSDCLSVTSFYNMS
nr:NADH dehydrogenase subunit 4L [Vignadula atrata]